MQTTARTLAVLTSYCLVTAGCHQRIDTRRDPVDTGSFGQTVVTLACKRIAYLEDLADGGTTDVRGDTYRDDCREGLAAPAGAPPALAALLARYDLLTDATDTVFPDAFLPILQAYLTSNAFLSSYDDGTAIDAVDALVGLFELIASDAAALDALARFNVRLGYRPLAPALGAIRAAVQYPELAELLLVLTQAIAPGGSARGEWEHLAEALAVTLRNTETAADPADPTRTAALAADLLLSERPYLGTSKTIPLARRDPRGFAQPVSLVGLFRDADGDGYADVGDDGQFVGPDGAPAKTPAPFLLPEGSNAVPWTDFDDAGRPVDGSGGLVYRYVDVDKTVLAAVARDGVQLFDPSRGTALDLLRGASLLLGPRVQTTRSYDNGETLTYRGHDLEESALLDMAHAYLQVLRDPNVHDLLGLGRLLLVDHPGVIARLAEAAVSAARLGDNHPGAEIPADAPLWDDLMPVIRQVLARPALVTALLTALERPEVKQLGERFRKQMTYKDRFDIVSNAGAGHPVTGSFATPVDRTALDSAFNRSLWQRLLHLIHDTNGARLCNKQGAVVRDPVFGIPLATYDRCALVDVPSMAVLYVQSIAYAKDAGGRYICENNAGNQTVTVTDPQQCVTRGDRIRPKANLNFQWGSFVASSLALAGGDGYIESESTIRGFRTHPTPQALNRALFLQPMPALLADTMDPARDRDNDLMTDQHIGTLPVWEVEGFYDQIRPIVQAFADHNSEQLFIDFLSALHRHWPTDDSVTHQTVDPNAPGYVWGSGAMHYEPLIADILQARKLLDALVDLAPTLNGLVVNARPYAQIVRQAGSFLLTPLPGLADRQGNTSTTTSDGRPVATMSPWHLVADAYQVKRARMDGSTTEATAWTDSVAEVVDVLVRAQEVTPGVWQFRNPRFRGVAVALIDFLRARILAHDATGDRSTWLATDLPGRLSETLSSPVFAGAADFVLSLQAAPRARQQLELLLRYLVDEISSADGDLTFRTALTVAADLLQLAVADADVAPLARLAGEALAPERGWLDAHLVFVRRAREADADGALSELVVHLFDETRPGRTAVGDLIDGISEIHRSTPYTDLGKRYTAADFASLMLGLAGFLDDEKRGLRKFIGIIRDRNL
jgi:hypothetical protein